MLRVLGVLSTVALFSTSHGESSALAVIAVPDDAHVADADFRTGTNVEDDTLILDFSALDERHMCETVTEASQVVVHFITS